MTIQSSEQIEIESEAVSQLKKFIDQDFIETVKFISAIKGRVLLQDRSPTRIENPSQKRQ